MWRLLWLLFRLFMCLSFVSYLIGFRIVFLFFFFKQKTAYEMRISDWSSDVCSSDLLLSEKLRLVIGALFFLHLFDRLRARRGIGGRALLEIPPARVPGAPRLLRPPDPVPPAHQLPHLRRRDAVRARAGVRARPPARIPARPGTAHGRDAWGQRR